MVLRISTGIVALDRELATNRKKGIPEGSMVVLEAPPGSQSEAIVRSFMKERPTMYVPTLRSAESVETDLDESFPDAEYTVRDADVETPIDDCLAAVEAVDCQANVIIDTVNTLEATSDRAQYVAFLDDLATVLRENDGVGVLLATRSADRSSERAATLSVADLVWELRTVVEEGSVKNFLHVRKYRGNDLPGATIKLDLGRDVTVDTSRDIA